LNYFAGDFLENVVLITALAAGLSCKGCNGKPHTAFIDIGKIEGLSFVVGDFTTGFRLGGIVAPVILALIPGLPLPAKTEAGQWRKAASAARKKKISLK
jgi:hypothetical protein